MMQKILQYTRPYKSPEDFAASQWRNRYQEWDKRSRQVHISVISLLTVALYVIFSLLDRTSWAFEVEPLMLKLHLLIIVPMMLMISFFAFKKRFYNVVMFALALSPIVAITIHTYLVSQLFASQLSNPTPYLNEGYLMVIWIFIVSGMAFNYAVVSAVATSAILVITSYFYMSERGLYVMHVFWIFCSFSFGFVGGLIFDRARKSLFKNMQELQRLAITDPLTGLFNRNQLTQVIAEEIGRSDRYDRTFGVLVIDIDHFKNINDTFGHDVGDAVLQQTADVLSAAPSSK
ncbi:MAG: GGDEF domain-containing protein [Methylophilaceae bacterium]